MSLDKTELKQLLDRVIFQETDPQDWVQDIWELNPVMGENAANLYEVYAALIEHCPAERLAALWQQLYHVSRFPATPPSPQTSNPNGEKL